MYPVVAFFTKLSLFILYHRLFARHLWIKYLVYFGTAFCFVMYTISFGVSGYLCLPHHNEGWVEATLSVRCHRQDILIAYIRGPLNLLTDLYLLVLPLSAIWQLHLPLHKKVGVSGIFFTGFLYVTINSMEAMRANLLAPALRVPSVYITESRGTKHQTLLGILCQSLQPCEYL